MHKEFPSTLIASLDESVTHLMKAVDKEDYEPGKIRSCSVALHMLSVHPELLKGKPLYRIVRLTQEVLRQHTTGSDEIEVSPQDFLRRWASDLEQIAEGVEITTTRYAAIGFCGALFFELKHHKSEITPEN